MARAWSLDGPHLKSWAGAGSPVPIKQPLSAGQHAAVMENPDQFDSLHRKNDFLAEGVHTVFGIKDGEAELQGLYFQANRFTPAEAKQWLQERGLEPLVFMEATEGKARGHTHHGSGRQGSPTKRNRTGSGKSLRKD